MDALLFFLVRWGQEFWQLLVDSSLYIIAGLVVGGLLKMMLSPQFVANHLGEGRYRSVIKASFLGIPIPLCSCGVLPAAQQLKTQGANKGAVTSFLISTPESGVDSIAVSWALLDPIMTVARPCAAFFSAMTAGFLENLIEYTPPKKTVVLPMVSGQLSHNSSSHEGHDHASSQHHVNKIGRLVPDFLGAMHSIWTELATWFFIGLVAAALIMVLVPAEWFSQYLGGGLVSMLLMLLVGIPMYICATASTPVAAALILKGVSPGAALVFLLAGPATNITSLAVLLKILGKRATGIYLTVIGVMSVVCGMLVDAVYLAFGVQVTASIGATSEFVPYWLMVVAAILLALVSMPILYKEVSNRVHGRLHHHGDHPDCSSGCCHTHK